MARDAVLQDYSRDSGECVLSIYSWIRPTLSFGRNQAAKGLYDIERITAEKIDVVRRPTGGRAILHDHEITYSVTGPDSFASSLSEAYDAINMLLVSALRRLDVPAEIAQPSRPSPAPDQSPCFAEPVKGELIARGRKLVGSAQYREAGAFLQHGSILVENDQVRLSDLTLGISDAASGPSPATLSELVTTPVTPQLMAEAMFESVRALQDRDAELLDESRIRADALSRRAAFLDPLWTWRR